ncbi:MAG: STAS/SEC14 domain-containing protein [Paracoccaceae bacterium]
MSKHKTGSFGFAEGFPPDVIAVTAHGHITRGDYERDLIPKVLERVRAEGRVKLLYEIGPDFSGFSAGAAWDDAKLGLLHLSDFAKVAVVTDHEWIRLGTKIFAPLIPCPVHLFHLSERAAAKEWICADAAEKPHKPGVDATHKIPPLEDRIPPEA